ncbi:MBL fold metallo-hydrolase [Euzebya tangerina]|uniref:MBL fold metallo-hydrolase n=1 Tax=Euzebya tangerina TaxID=591198 RepID=UPI000E317F6B|nr:MBL fold metallo-hydrolase [Euzebya tangerina]
MSDTFIDVLTLGMWQANCYVIGNLEQREAVVIDPGQGGDGPVQEILDERGVTCQAILLTHGHLDHLWAVPSLVADLDVPVRMHAEDRWLWDSPAAAFGAPPAMLQTQFGLDWQPPTEHLETFGDGQTMALAGLAFTAHHTPGHTPGSSVFITDQVGPAPVMVSGDLIFAGSVGRTDFPRGSRDTQDQSIRRVVLPQPDETRIISGHGPETTVGRERLTNPFVVPLTTH